MFFASSSLSRFLTKYIEIWFRLVLFQTHCFMFCADANHLSHLIKNHCIYLSNNSYFFGSLLHYKNGFFHKFYLVFFQLFFFALSFVVSRLFVSGDWCTALFSFSFFFSIFLYVCLDDQSIETIA